MHSDVTLGDLYNYIAGGMTGKVGLCLLPIGYMHICKCSILCFLCKYMYLYVQLHVGAWLMHGRDASYGGFLRHINVTRPNMTDNYY